MDFTCKPALGFSAVVLALLLVGVGGDQQLMPLSEQQASC